MYFELVVWYFCSSASWWYSW